MALEQKASDVAAPPSLTARTIRALLDATHHSNTWRDHRERFAAARLILANIVQELQRTVALLQADDAEPLDFSLQVDVERRPDSNPPPVPAFTFKPSFVVPPGRYSIVSAMLCVALALEREIVSSDGKCIGFGVESMDTREPSFGRKLLNFVKSSVGAPVQTKSPMRQMQELQRTVWEELAKNRQRQLDRHSPAPEEAKGADSSSSSAASHAMPRCSSPALSSSRPLFLSFEAMLPGAPNLTQLIELYSCDPNGFNDAGDTPLLAAITQRAGTASSIDNRLGWLQRLCDSGADPNLASRGRIPFHTSPLHLAATVDLDDARMFLLLLGAGANPQQCNGDNDTPMQLLVRNGGLLRGSTSNSQKLEQVTVGLLELLRAPSAAGSDASRRQHALSWSLLDPLSSQPVGLTAPQFRNSLLCELIDERLATPDAIHRQDAHVWCTRHDITDGVMQRSIARVLQPPILAEISVFLIPDLAALCTEFLVPKSAVHGWWAEDGPGS